MTDSSIPLTPDDKQRDSILLTNAHAKPEQPYGMTAVLTGMALLLLTSFLLPHMTLLARLGGALTAGLLIYVILLAMRPALPILALAIIAAELGLLYGLPATHLFINPFSQNAFNNYLDLAMRVITAGLVGFIVARALVVERFPRTVIAINFLYTFVCINLISLLKR